MTDELDKIKKELSELRLSFSQKLTALQERVSKVEKENNASTPLVSAQETDVQSPLLVRNEISQEGIIKPVISSQQPPPWKQDSTNNTKTSSDTLKKDVVETSFLDSLQFILGPFNTLIQPIIDIYKKFEKEEKLAVFFLTFSGILALVLGFAYVLQYSFANLLNETAKVIIGIIISVAIIGLGAKISITKSKMHEYGASLIGLGFTLIYLCLFFMTSYYGIVGTTVGFVLLALNSFIGYSFAFKFETKIVAGISFIGGVFTPFFLGGEASLSVQYSLYLLLISAAALILANKIRWYALTLTSFIVSFAVLEYVMFSGNLANQNQYAFVAIIHAFFYLYTYYNLFSGKTLLAELDKKQIYTVVGATIYTLANLFALVNSPFTLGLIFLVNALPFIILITPLNLAVTAKQRSLMLLLAGTFVGFAIPALFGLSIAGLFWAMEGVLLLHLSFQYKSISIRREGYVLIIISLIKMTWMALFLASHWQQGLLNSAFLNLLSIGLVAYAIAFTINKHSNIADSFDNKIKSISNEASSLWMAVVFFVVSIYFVSPYHLLLGIIPLFYLIHRSYKFSLPFTHSLALAHIGLIIVQITLSIQDANSFRFTEQSLLGKIAIVEIFFLLAGMQYFYERFAAQSTWLYYAKKLRIIFFFLIPILLLPTILRRVPEYFALALWCSYIVSYYIASWKKHSVLKSESLALYAVATIYSIIYALTNMPSSLLGTTALALYLGPIIGFFILWKEKGTTRLSVKNSWCTNIFTAWYIHVGIVVSAIIFVTISRLDVALFALSSYFIYLSMRTDTLPALRNILRPLFYIGFFTLSAMIVIHTIIIDHYPNAWLSIILNIFSLVILFKVSHDTKLIHLLILGKNKIIRQNNWSKDIWFSHILTLFTYATVIYMISGDWLGPVLTIALVIHATFILFKSLNESYKSILHLATILFGMTVLKIFMHDLEGFSLIQKIMAFMVIGVILLAAAYKFQQFRNNQEKMENEA